MVFGFKKESRGALPSKDSKLNDEIEKQEQESKSIKNFGNYVTR